MLPQLRAVHLVGPNQGTGDAQAYRARLAGQSAPVYPRPNDERPQCVRRRERLLNVLDQRTAGKIITEGSAVDVPLSGTGGQVHAGDARLASSETVPTKFGLCDCHSLLIPSLGRAAWAAVRCADDPDRRTL